MKIKALLEIGGAPYRSAGHAGWTISQRIGSRGLALAAKAEDEDPEYHKEHIESLKKAIATNPEWAALMLPKMKARLAQHEKRLAELQKLGK